MLGRRDHVFLPRRARLGDCRANRYETVGRWQRERDEPFRKICQEAFAEALEEFGYE